jgi:Tol biopolymer transport system component
LWAPGSFSARYTLEWVDRHGIEAPAPIAQASYNEAELSPDGKRVAMVGGTAGSSDLWISDLERGTQARMTTGESVLNPTWSPDGRTVAYVIRTENANKERRWQILLKPSDGSRDATVLFDSPQTLTLGDFTPDGKEIVFGSQVPGGAKGDILSMPVAGSGAPRTILSDEFNKREAVVSPDGRYFAYTSNEGGQVCVYVRPFPSGEGRWLVSPPVSVEPRWGRGGDELFFRSRASIYRVALETKGGFSPGKAEILFDRVRSGGNVKTYRPSADGARFFTFRTPDGRGSMRTVNLDLGFAERIAKQP